MRISRPRLLLLATVTLLCGGCAAIRNSMHTCALLVIVDDGRYLPSPQQMARIERWIAPQLVERGLVLSHDMKYAEMIARVEFESDASNPLEGNFTLRTIAPNPLLGMSETAPTDPQFETLQKMQDQLNRKARSTR